MKRVVSIVAQQANRLAESYPKTTPINWSLSWRRKDFRVTPNEIMWPPNRRDCAGCIASQSRPSDIAPKLDTMIPGAELAALGENISIAIVANRCGRACRQRV
jgi:hypothetical protein